jgi:small basic protein
MLAFLYTSGLVQLAVLVLVGLFLFITGPVFLAVVNDLRSQHSNLVNGIYMTTNFIMSAVMVMIVGFMGDHLNLEITYLITAILAFGAIPFAYRIKVS